MAAVKFEEALGRLETLVQTLERGDLSLDESLKAFEEGVKLSKSCVKLLDEAERRVDILLGEGGNRKVKPFPLADTAPAEDDSDADDASADR
jgi:exodeoxyribonuclease VII small subunit